MAVPEPGTAVWPLQGTVMIESIPLSLESLRAVLETGRGIE
jgi:hypothetical protein